MQTYIKVALPAGSNKGQKGLSISPNRNPIRPESPPFPPPKLPDDNPISKALEEIARAKGPISEIYEHTKEKLGESENPLQVSLTHKIKDENSTGQEASEAQGDTESGDERLKAMSKQETKDVSMKGKNQGEQDRIMPEKVSKMFSEIDQSNLFGYAKQQLQQQKISFKTPDEIPSAYAALIKGKATERVKGRSRLERPLKDKELRKGSTTSGDDEEEEFSYDKELKYILAKKLDADLALASASHSLRAADTKFSEMQTEMNHAVLKMQKLITCLNLTTKERDELKHEIEELKKKNSVSVDLEPLRTLIVRVHGLVEEFSSLFMKCLEQNFHTIIRPIWSYVPDTAKERLIRYLLIQKMFLGFENESFSVNEGAIPVFDVDVLRNESLETFQELSNKTVENLKVEDGEFRQFYYEKKITIFLYLRKTVHLVSVVMGKEMFKDMEKVFGNLVKEVWAMHKLALSMEWRVRILRAQKGALFDKRWMTAMDCPTEDVHELEGQKKYVHFMAMPGFQVGDSLVTPCRVHLM